MRIKTYLIFFILLNIFFINEVLAGVHSKNYCDELQNFLNTQSSSYLSKSTKYSCFEKNGFYHIYPDGHPKNIKKIPSGTVEDFYNNENINSKNKILDIIFIKGIK